MTTDHRIAKSINVTMFTIFVLAGFALGTWLFAAEFTRVREIYAGLRVDQQRHVNGLLATSSYMLMMLWLVRQTLAGWLKPDRLRGAA